MRFGGVQPFTLSDYPGCVACILFTQGCNFRCPYCHNPSLVLPELFQQPISEEKIMRYLHQRVGKLDGVVITGGEPTIHNDLITWIEKIKTLGYKVKLDTNGSNPHVIKQLLEKNLIDFCALDIKAPWHKYSLLTGKSDSVAPVQETFHLLLLTDIPRIFRITYVPSLLDEADLEEVKSYLPPNQTLIIQKFVGENTLSSIVSDLSDRSDRSDGSDRSDLSDGLTADNRQLRQT